LVPQPVPDTILGDATHYLVKTDQYLGEKDHFAGTIWRQTTPIKFFSALPIRIANETLSHPQDSWVNRINWDHTFSPTLLNHLAFGSLNRNEGYGAVDMAHAADVPQIPGVLNHNTPSQIQFSDNFAQFGNNSGISTSRGIQRAQRAQFYVHRNGRLPAIQYRHLVQRFRQVEWNCLVPSKHPAGGAYRVLNQRLLWS
jgi:hypothetical protein